MCYIWDPLTKKYLLFICNSDLIGYFLFCKSSKLSKEHLFLHDVKSSDQIAIILNMAQLK